MTFTDEEVRFLANWFGLTPDDLDDLRQALEDLRDLGGEAFIEQTQRDGDRAVAAARAGERPSDDVVRRTNVRGRIADALTWMGEIKIFPND